MIEKGGRSPHNGRKHLPMNPRITADDHYRIVYDADQLDTASVDMFEPGYWGRNGAAANPVLGRGSACKIRGPFGEAVLKRYYRGGQVARWNRDLYLFTGVERSRPFREFRLLAWMYEQNLPVPVPVAALLERNLFSCRGALITILLAGTASFSMYLRQGNVGTQLWRSIGACIRRFHDAGVKHADLNVNNILIDTQGQVYLVDFDKSRRCRVGEHWKQANLQRLNRSLKKLSRHHTVDLDWPALAAGYRGLS